ncbi:MAG: NAD-dependent epimerase/dehydratase family protein [Thermoanaerobaculia bacterium]
MRSVFITGATGFVGSHTARKFAADGWHVKALVRRPERPGLLPPGAEVVAGEIGEAKGYSRFLEGCDAVVHAAGATKARSLSEYRETNARGTAELARASARACPSAMFVLVSSQSAAGPSRDGSPVREVDAPRPVSWYGISKLEGEEAVARERDGPWCAVRPCVVYGPGDPGLLQLFSLAARGWAPVLAGGRSRIQVIAAADLARVISAAASRPDLSGRRGFAAGAETTTGELVSCIASLRHPRARLVPVPAAMIRAAGWAESVREAITRRARPFNRDKAREILQPDWVCDSAPFLSELGVESLADWRSGMRETALWYQREGWIAPSFAQL